MLNWNGDEEGMRPSCKKTSIKLYNVNFFVQYEDGDGRQPYCKKLIFRTRIHTVRENDIILRSIERMLQTQLFYGP
jgi:hypothetical protein